MSNTKNPADVALIESAHASCPISDIGWLAEAEGDLVAATAFHREASAAMRRAQRPDWHKLNRAARIEKAAADLTTAESRIDRARSALQSQIIEWDRGERIYDSSAHHGTP